MGRHDVHDNLATAVQVNIYRTCFCAGCIQNHRLLAGCGQRIGLQPEGEIKGTIVFSHIKRGQNKGVICGGKVNRVADLPIDPGGGAGAIVQAIGGVFFSWLLTK